MARRRENSEKTQIHFECKREKNPSDTVGKKLLHLTACQLFLKQFERTMHDEEEEEEKLGPHFDIIFARCRCRIES